MAKGAGTARTFSRSEPRLTTRIGIIKLLCAVILGAALTTSLAGCSSPNQDAQRALTEALKPLESEGVATIDLDEVVPGAWSKAILVCRGASENDLDDALGFPWREGPDLGSAGFGAMFVFSTAGAVESYVNLGQDKFNGNDSYVSPCPVASDIGIKVSTVSVMERPASNMTFRYDPSTYSQPTWIYIPG